MRYTHRGTLGTGEAYDLFRSCCICGHVCVQHELLQKPATLSGAVRFLPLADPVGGVAGVATPSLNLKKNSGHPCGRCDRFTHVAAVVDLIVTSSNNACLCALNCVTVRIKPSLVKNLSQRPHQRHIGLYRENAIAIESDSLTYRSKRICA